MMTEPSYIPTDHTQGSSFSNPCQHLLFSVFIFIIASLMNVNDTSWFSFSFVIISIAHLFSWYCMFGEMFTKSFWLCLSVLLMIQPRAMYLLRELHFH